MWQAIIRWKAAVLEKVASHFDDGMALNIKDPKEPSGAGEDAPRLRDVPFSPALLLLFDSAERADRGEGSADVRGVVGRWGLHVSEISLMNFSVAQKSLPKVPD